jgi:hypothetical protein
MKKLMGHSCWAASVAVLFLLSSVGFSATVTKTFRDGTDSYTGTKDTFIDEVIPDAVPANNQRLNINFGDNPEHTEALIKFDLSSIPSYATVTSANLMLTETRIVDNDAADVIIIDRVTSSWSETTTWNTRPSSTPTTITTPAIDSISPGTTNVYSISGLEGLVQLWVTNSVENFGIKLSATNSSLNFRVSSREDATDTFRPALEVTYTVPDPVLTLIIVTPSNSTIAKLGGLQYSAIAFDQFGVAMTGVVFNWSVTGVSGTTIDSSGLLTTGSVPGSYTVKATSGSIEASVNGEVRLGGTLIFQNGLNGYAGTDDTYLNQFGTTTDNGTATSLYFNWDTNSVGTVTENQQSLIRFQLSSIPTNAVIKSATLTVINTSRAELDASDVVKIGILTNSWTESSTYATYLPAYVDSGVTLPSVLGYTGASEPYVVSNLATMIQGWVTVPANNLGFIIHTPSDMLFRIASSESSTSTNRPKLEVSYILPVQVLTSISVTPNSVLMGNGSTQTFTAAGYDQAGNLMDPQPIFSWSTSGGSVDASGIYTATTTGTFTVTASADGKSGSANVEVGTLVTLQEGVNGYLGTIDSYIDQVASANNGGTLNHLDIWYKYTNTVVLESREVLVKFDLASSTIPTNATIASANMIFVNTKTSNADTNDLILLSKTTSPWVENTVCWTNAPTAVASGITTPTVVGVTNGGIYTIGGLQNIVKEWIDNPGNNFGVKFSMAFNPGATTTNINFNFASSEHTTVAMRPKLQVIYTMPAIVADSDGDTLPDVWEMAQFGNLSFGPDDDVDGDGLTNIQEFSAGTAGNSSGDRFVASNQGFVLSDFTITWSSVIGHNYTVESSADLVTWSPAGVVLNVPSTSTSWSDVAPTETKKFYRVKTQ